MNMIRYEPRYRPLSLLDRLLRDEDLHSLLRPSGETDVVTDWLPAVDIREETDRFVLHADLPGVDPADIHIAMEDGVLTIRGERNTRTEDSEAGYKRTERVRGSFLRKFTLPDTADDAAVSATTKHGVLEISIPKQAKPQPRRIDVQVS